MISNPIICTFLAISPLKGSSKLDSGEHIYNQNEEMVEGEIWEEGGVMGTRGAEEDLGN